MSRLRLASQSGASIPDSLAYARQIQFQLGDAKGNSLHREAGIPRKNNNLMRLNGGADGPRIQPSPRFTLVAMTAKMALRDIASARSCIAESSRIVAFTDT